MPWRSREILVSRISELFFPFSCRRPFVNRHFCFFSYRLHPLSASLSAATFSLGSERCEFQRYFEYRAILKSHLNLYGGERSTCLLISIMNII